MNALDALDALLTMIGAAPSVPADISAFAALIARARAEGRDIAPAEISALQSQDDQTRLALAAEIAKLE